MYLSTPLGKVDRARSGHGQAALGARHAGGARPALRRLGEPRRVVLAGFARGGRQTLRAPHRVRRASTRGSCRWTPPRASTARDFGQGGVVDLKPVLRNKQSCGDEYEQTSPPAIIGDLIVVGSAIADNSATTVAQRRSARVRCAHRRVALDLESRAAGSRRIRRMRPGRAMPRNAAAARTPGPSSRPIPTRDLVFLPDHEPGRRLLRRHAARRQPLREFRGRAARLHRQNGLALPDRASRSVGLRQRRAAGADHAAERQGRRAAGRRRPRSCSCSIALTGAAAVPGARKYTAPKSDVPGEDTSPTQPLSALSLNFKTLTARRHLGRDARGSRRMPPRASRRCVTTGRSRHRRSAARCMLPSNIGGAHWGGVAYDSGRGIAVVPNNQLAAVVTAHPAREVEGDEGKAHQGRARRQGIHRHERHAVRHAARDLAVEQALALHGPAVRFADRDQPQDRQDVVERAARHRRKVSTRSACRICPTTPAW